MRLRGREVAWLVALGALLAAVQGLDERTRALHQRSEHAGASARAAAAGLPADAVDPARPFGVAAGSATPLAGTEAALSGATSVTISAAQLAAMPWGANPFRGRAPRRDGALAAGEPEDVTPDEASAPPRFQGVARFGDQTLAALDGRFCAPGDVVGAWTVVSIAGETVTIRNRETGQGRTLRR